MRPLDDVFQRLSRSAFRQRFTLDGSDRAYLQRRGLSTVLLHGRDFIATRLAPAAPANDGRQTPWRGHPVFVAQHATACCCRGCLAKWHDIPAGRALDDAERAHVLAALARWLREQAPEVVA